MITIPRFRSIGFLLFVTVIIAGGIFISAKAINAFIAESAPKSKAAVADKTAPSISNVSVTPISGAVGAKFKIKAKVTDSGGIKRVYARIRDANNNILTNINLYDDGSNYITIEKSSVVPTRNSKGKYWSYGNGEERFNGLFLRRGKERRGRILGSCGYGPGNVAGKNVSRRRVQP